MEGDREGVGEEQSNHQCKLSCPLLEGSTLPHRVVLM